MAETLAWKLRVPNIDRTPEVQWKCRDSPPTTTGAPESFAHWIATSPPSATTFNPKASTTALSLTLSSTQWAPPIISTVSSSPVVLTSGLHYNSHSYYILISEIILVLL
ncbi:unnamed protein product [Ilex paraguariensis]|uniref:Uncharacterized protein n=1 Tax=Ilex paraguariensis TaxID=185542 RepID=A0ABC8R4L4_9AQUA